MGQVMIDYNVTINGLKVQANYSNKAVDEIFLPLLNNLAKIQRQKKRRILVMLAAPPGAGKSTLVSFLEKLSLENNSVGKDGIPEIQAIGMDGFHRRQEYLVSHTTVRDGVEIPMVKIKGAPETFDLELFKERIEKVRSEKECGWPVYDRTLHNPVDNVITVNKDIVILEGNYLLLNEAGWDELSKYADYTISVTADEELLRNRLIQRKALSGNTIEDATAFVDYSDMVNVRTCLEKTKQADLELKVVENEGKCDYCLI